ncbi:helicase-related protein [Parafrankia elaeagni]|uniref:helicase-related protein n=1 Tax=Parafrankia elaeagni TaxID=222534 RepID=UPI000A0198B2|nr:C-terminal helicase domain-containing protein [Parafrankia elaeagni]
MARRVRSADTDRKWSELRTILRDDLRTRDESGQLGKIILFTEHRDTQTYLVERITTLLGDTAAVEFIHGGLSRERRLAAQRRFTSDPRARVLVATDAAGEGVNLQVAHLMVNYDLPWNPNRIEQRFGRIHRIGQGEVCHLWNPVATDTREGDVFHRLLEKIEQQHEAYSGKVFDVLGQAFADRPLRDLLIEAIRYGDSPDVRGRLHEIIDAAVGTGLVELLDERALHTDVLAAAQVDGLRRRHGLAPADAGHPYRAHRSGCWRVSRPAGRASRLPADHLRYRARRPLRTIRRHCTVRRHCAAGLRGAARTVASARRGGRRRGPAPGP